MNDTKVIYSLAGLVVGIILTAFFAAFAVNGNHTGMMRGFGMHPYGYNNSGTMMNNIDDDDISSMMGAMSGSLDNKTGDQFDNAFLSQMIIHHQGAIVMANLALANAKHQEIKDLAKSIIDAQTKEINQMKSWQQQWYK